MINQIIPIPVFYDRSSGPVTEEDVKILVGIYIVASILFFITSVVAAIKYIIYERRGNDYSSFWEYYFLGGNLFLSLYNCTMSICHFVVLIIYLGVVVSKFI
jgi:hypothetical protein